MRLGASLDGNAQGERRAREKECETSFHGGEEHDLYSRPFQCSRGTAQGTLDSHSEEHCTATHCQDQVLALSCQIYHSHCHIIRSPYSLITCILTKYSVVSYVYSYVPNHQRNNLPTCFPSPAFSKSARPVNFLGPRNKGIQCGSSSNILLYGTSSGANHSGRMVSVLKCTAF